MNDREVMEESLHIYAQSMWHDEAFIVGGAKAITALRDALTHALEHGRSDVTLCASDGEGYSVIVVLANEDDIDELKMPYTDHTINFGDGDHPYSLIMRDVKARKA